MVFLAVLASRAEARSQPTYYFLVSEVKLAEGIPAEIAEIVRAELTQAITKHARLIEALPADAPDPAADPKAFTRYITKRKIRPFRVNVEVTQYNHKVTTSARGGQQLVVSVALRTFGETIPQRVMAFSGDGSATIKMDIGKELRPRDSRVANKDAVAQAIADALTMSLDRLDKAGTEKKRKK